MEYTLRKIKSRDLGKVCRIISKIGIQEIVDNFDMSKIVGDFNAKDMKDEKNAAQVGIRVAAACGDTVMKNLDRCMDDVLEYLEDLSGIDKDVIDEDPAMMVGMIMDYFKKEEFRDFFKVVSKYVNKMTI